MRKGLKTQRLHFLDTFFSVGWYFSYSKWHMKGEIDVLGWKELESQVSTFKQNYMYLNLCLDFQLGPFRFSATQKMLGKPQYLSNGYCTQCCLNSMHKTAVFLHVFMVGFFVLILTVSEKSFTLSHGFHSSDW